MNVDHLVTMIVQSKKKKYKNKKDDNIWEGLSYILVFALIVPVCLLLCKG